MNFSEFVGFIHEQADIVNDPLYGIGCAERPSQKGCDGKIRFQLTNSYPGHL